MKSLFLVILIVCSNLLQAQATRVKAEYTDSDGRFVVSWGTVTMIDDKFVTCAHVVEKAEVIYIESRGSWIRSDIVKTGDGIDLVQLKPDYKIDATDERAHGCFCYGSPESALVKRFDAKFETDKVMKDYIKVKGFRHGMSGSPVNVDGALAAICTGFISLDGGKTEKKDCVHYVPIEIVKKFLKKD